MIENFLAEIIEAGKKSAREDRTIGGSIYVTPFGCKFIQGDDFDYREYRRQRMMEQKFNESVYKRNLEIKRGQVIFQDHNTVLRVGDEKYIAKCEKGDKFDPEKGLLVCLIKALGLTTTDMQKMLEKAEFKNSEKKAKAVKQGKRGR